MTQTLQDCFERCCRLCAEEQDVTIMIFSKEAEEMLLQNKLNRYLLIAVDEDDKLPKNICIQCCTKLQSVCDFIDTARKAQEVLLERCFMIDQMARNKYMTSQEQGDIKQEPMECFENDQYTEKEIKEDPTMVLKNSDITLVPTGNHDSNKEDIIYLHHALDTENVTIKLIKKGDKESSESISPSITTKEKNNQPTTSQSSHDSDDDDEKKSPSVKPFKCTICARSFCSDLALKNHTWTHNLENKIEKQYTCQTCNEKFHYKYDLITHLKTHRKNGICQLCGRMFRSERTYVTHMAVHLPSSPLFTCKTCGRSYNTWGGLKTHRNTHSTKRPYNCQYCKKTFKRNQDLKFHTNQHTGARPYKCPFCEKRFASSGNCYSHRSRMHPGEKPKEPIRATVPLQPTTPPSASPPSASPPSASPPSASPPSASNPSNAYNIDNNLVTVNGITKYQCHLCEHRFVMRDNFSYHMYQHTGEKPFKCLHCTEEFVTRRGLLIHHDNLHPDMTRPIAAGFSLLLK